jgi:hypothetical protein
MAGRVAPALHDWPSARVASVLFEAIAALRHLAIPAGILLAQMGRNEEVDRWLLQEGYLHYSQMVRLWFPSAMAGEPWCLGPDIQLVPEGALKQEEGYKQHL